MLMSTLEFIKDNYAHIFTLLASLLATVEGFVRLLPTKKKFTALERAGFYLRKTMDALKIPNPQIEDKADEPK